MSFALSIVLIHCDVKFKSPPCGRALIKIRQAVACDKISWVCFVFVRYVYVTENDTPIAKAPLLVLRKLAMMMEYWDEKYLSI